MAIKGVLAPPDGVEWGPDEGMGWHIFTEGLGNAVPYLAWIQRDLHILVYGRMY